MLAALLLSFATVVPALNAHAASSAVNSELIHKGELTIGTEGTFKPYSYRKNGKLTGFEVELGRAVAKKMGLKAKFVPAKCDSLLAGVNSGKFDVIMNGVCITKDRKEHYAFSKVYDNSPFVLIQKKDGNLTSLKQIKGKKIVAGVGTTNAAVIHKWGGELVQDDGNFATHLSLVRQGRGVATLTDEQGWQAYTANHQTKGLKAVNVSKDEDSDRIAAAFNKKNPALRKSFNKALDELRKDGTLAKISKKYFGKDMTK